MNVELPEPSQIAETLSIARRPILDRKSRLIAYELCFPGMHRGGPDEDHASRAILDDVVLFGLDRLTAGMPAFIPCNADMLFAGWVHVLPVDLVVLEVSAKIECGQLLVETCRNLQNSGFRLALADCESNPLHHPLYPFVSYVKFDLNHLRLVDPAQFLADPSIAIVATDINTQEDYREACKCGASLIQGLYFCSPDLIRSPKIATNHQVQLRVLRELQSDPLKLKRLGPVVELDASLVYRLLRMVNSPWCAVRQEVKSVESAILILGDDTFRRIAGLAILSELNAGQPSEVLNMAIVRARFCELAAKKARLNPNEQYLLGILSLLPAMLLCPMVKLAPDLPLRSEIRDALLGDPVPAGGMLAWIKSYEKQNFEECQDIALSYRLTQQELSRLYVDAVVWAASWQ